MKSALFMFVALTLVLLTISEELDAKAGNANVQACRRRVQANCTPNGKSCVRHARTNLCEQFDNDCEQQLANCNNVGLSRALYQRVNMRLCSGMPVNQRLPCGGRSNSNSNGSNTPLIYA